MQYLSCEGAPMKEPCDRPVDPLVGRVRKGSADVLALSTASMVSLGVSDPTLACCCCFPCSCHEAVGDKLHTRTHTHTERERERGRTLRVLVGKRWSSNIFRHKK
jgi:hypothetical protein